MNGHVGAQLDCSVVVTGIGPVFLLDDFVVMCTNMFVYVYNYTEGIRSQASRHIRAYLSGQVRPSRDDRCVATTELRTVQQTSKRLSLLHLASCKSRR